MNFIYFNPFDGDFLMAHDSPLLANLINSLLITVQGKRLRENGFLTYVVRCFVLCLSFGGFSSVGRASDLHSEGQEFESPSLHFVRL